jgi:hypothetical protein
MQYYHNYGHLYFYFLIDTGSGTASGNSSADATGESASSSAQQTVDASGVTDPISGNGTKFTGRTGVSSNSSNVRLLEA